MGRNARNSLARAEQDRVRQVIAEAREAAGVSQRGLSKLLGESAPYVWLIEKGERTVDLVEFMDIAKALGVDPVELFKKTVG